MKFTLFQGLAILACSLAVLNVGVHAQEPCDPADPSCIESETQIPCDLDLEIFCSDPVSQLEADFEQMLTELPTENPDEAATGAPARRRSYPAIVKRNLIDDVKNYFKTYWKALGLIVKGEFGEGIFLQLKNSGSWCNNDNWFVKAIKKGIEKLSGGGLTAICECLVPMVDQYESFNKLKEGVGANGLTDVLKGCSENMRKQIKSALKKAGSITKVGGKP
ncbi:hypothetical protein BG015_011949 [Linnemannia schmuckeri]|uniref:Secreted protein n=1 Tax=Linnemannia schmuckeri TaxID=64567 RepID=A0A9P5RVC1_9FUNG|nr:hypothetical protein BG015_011949 [Linnemannia schmuckeri]